MKIKCIGIDDHQTSLDLLQDHVSKLDYLQWAGSFTDPLKAITEMDGLQPDLIFLDMQMPGMSGLEFLRTKKPEQPVIIISDFKDYAFDSYAISNEHNIVVVDYLAKIILLPRFIQACEKAKLHLQNTPQDDEHIIFAKTIKNHLMQIDLNKVQFIEAEEQEMAFYGEDYAKPLFRVRITMGELEQRLSRLRYLRLHRKYLVNPKYISSFQPPDLVKMENKREISVGKTYQDDTKEYFLTKRLG